MERANFINRLRPSDTQPLSLGQYRVLDEIGRGGMGQVYKALHTIMGREVALKVISPELVSDPIAVEWFLREVRASTQLHHPNIVMAYDANEAEGLFFLVMEYVHGVTLDALVKQRGPLPIAYACALMRQAALGLQHAHEKGMVHRDIKPSNLLVPYPPTPTLPHKGGGSNNAPSPQAGRELLSSSPQAGRELLSPSPLVGEGGGGGADVLVKILDFGLARLHGKTKGDTISLRGEAGVLGTPDYIAPEQSRDIHAADIRSDLYSLGCVFYFVLTGRVPFPGDNAMEKLIKHLMEQPDSVEEIRPGVPPELVVIVRRLMAKDPADRYQTPAELVRELEKLPGTFSEAPPEAFSTPFVEAPSDPQPEYTRLLNNLAVFAPSLVQAEPSGPSMLEPLWKYAPEDRRHPATHDTLTTSNPGDSERATAEALAPCASPGLESGSTFQDLTIPGKKGGLASQAPSSEPLPPIDPVVFRLWRRWLALLERIIAGHGPSRVNNETYQTIHALLLQACRAAIDACPVPERRAFYEECLSIAQPWFKLQSFVHADAAMLDSLLRRCREIEVELNNGKPPWTVRQAVALALLALSPAGIVLWYFSYGRLWLPSFLKVFDGDFSLASLRSAWIVLQSHPALLIGVLFPLVIIFSFTLLSRTPRT